MTIKELRKNLRQLKKLFNLSWDISLRWGTEAEMDGNLGLAYMSAEQESAVILLAKGEGLDTLIHELLHVVFDGHKQLTAEGYDALHERALNKTAAVLVALLDG